MIDLSGQHIYVTGGSRGIGRAVAILAARAGADVSINYTRDLDAANAVLADIKKLGRQAVVVKADVGEDGEIAEALRQATGVLGPLTGVVASAGILEPTPIASATTAQWDHVINTNLRGTFHAVRDSVPHFKAAGGSIVIIASTSGQRGDAVYSAYSTSKAAQFNFMRSMAMALAARRIRVNCIAPAWTETDMAKSALFGEARDRAIKQIPMGRLGSPEDAGNAACFLLSPLAGFMTGSTITVDGGFDMRG